MKRATGLRPAARRSGCGLLITAAAAAAALGACTTQATQTAQATQATQATQAGQATELALDTQATGASAYASDATPDIAPPSSMAPAPAVATVGRPDLARLLAEGEAAYRSRRSDAALAAFEQVVAMEPDHALAWLRVGNLHQQRRDWFKALGAYRRAAARTTGEGTDPALRAKALYNLAMINLELVQQTLRALERMGPHAAAAGPRAPLSAAVAAARQRLEAFASPGERTVLQGSVTAGSGARASSSAVPAPAPRARSRVPLRDVPSRREAQPELPRVDYIQGAPRP